MSPFAPVSTTLRRVLVVVIAAALPTLVLGWLAAGCTQPQPGAKGADADPGAKGGVDKAARCASSFGAELTAAFGRIDGTVLAIRAPGRH